MLWGLGKLLSQFCESAAAVGAFSLLKTWVKLLNNHGNHIWIDTSDLACNHSSFPPKPKTCSCPNISLLQTPAAKGYTTRLAHTTGSWQPDCPLQMHVPLANHRARHKLGLLVSPYPTCTWHLSPWIQRGYGLWPVDAKGCCAMTYMSTQIGIQLGGMPDWHSCSPKTPFHSPLLQPRSVCPRNPLLLLCRWHRLLLRLWHQAKAPMEGICPPLKLVPLVSPHLLYCKELLSGSWKMKVRDMPGQHVQHFRSAG